MEIPGLFLRYISPQFTSGTGHGTVDFNDFLVGFESCFFSIPATLLFLFFLFFFLKLECFSVQLNVAYFYWGSQLSICIDCYRSPWCWTSSNTVTVKTLATLRIGSDKICTLHSFS